MTKVTTNHESSLQVVSGWRACFGRLFVTKFDSTKFRSQSAFLSDRNLKELELESHIRGRWDKRIEFVLSCIGFAVGLGNVWRFPIKVYENGGGAFVFPYIAFALILGCPLLLLEFGVGQFSGKGPAKCFKMVPIMFGLGWCMFGVSLAIILYYSVIIAWAHLYMWGSFRTGPKSLPWSHCGFDFNSPFCLSSDTPISKLNGSIKYHPSTEEFFVMYIQGFMKPNMSGYYLMKDGFAGGPIWHLSLSLLLVWILAAAGLAYGVKTSGKIIYFTALFPYIAIFSLAILGCTLPGAAEGLRFYFRTNSSKLLESKTYLVIIEQLFFSTSLAMGGMITYASYNDFSDNIYRDSILVVFVDFFTSLISGLAIFPILGYVAHRAQKPIESVITSGSSLFFITYPEALSTLPGGNLWTFLFMLMTVSLGMDSQFAMFETVCTTIGDTYPHIVRRSKLTKAITVCTIAALCYVVSLIFICPTGIYYFHILDTRVASFCLPIIAFLECITIAIYGPNRFRHDLRMMMGFSLNPIWMVFMTVITPLIIGIILIANIINWEPLTLVNKKLPQWAEILGYLGILIVMIGFPLGMIFILCKYKKRYSDLSVKEYSGKLITPPCYWGPYFKKNWLISKRYEAKLLKYKDDQKFLRSVPDSENFNAILTYINK